MRCDKLESFPKFYSDLRIIATNLCAANSIAVSDDSFPKAFLSGTINVDVLQQSTKDFLKEGNKTCSHIMDLFQVDYDAPESGSNMWDSNQPPKLRRAKSNDLPPFSGIRFKHHPNGSSHSVSS